jgi:quercetin dioxygenase-like cupin family protein
VSEKEARFLPRKTKLDMTHVNKGWGWERWICNGPEYCGKLLFFNEGKRCSWHVHRLKDEVFYLQSGKMMIYYSEDDDLTIANQLVLLPGENFHVYRGLRHQMVALEDSELFEFSTQHFDSDSYRIIKGD